MPWTSSLLVGHQGTPSRPPNSRATALAHVIVMWSSSWKVTTRPTIAGTEVVAGRRAAITFDVRRAARQRGISDDLVAERDPMARRRDAGRHGHARLSQALARILGRPPGGRTAPSRCARRCAGDVVRRTRLPSPSPPLAPPPSSCHCRQASTRAASTTTAGCQSAILPPGPPPEVGALGVTRRPTSSIACFTSYGAQLSLIRGITLKPRRSPRMSSVASHCPMCESPRATTVLLDRGVAQGADRDAGGARRTQSSRTEGSRRRLPGRRG